MANNNNNKYGVVYEGVDDDIIIYDTPTAYMFTTTYDGCELKRYIDKGSMSLEEIIKSKYDIEYDIIEAYR